MRVALLLSCLALAGCSALSPEKDVPPAPANLDYPKVGVVPPAPSGQPVLTREQRQKLEQDLDRYKVGPN